jgi:hypothetical protein
MPITAVETAKMMCILRWLRQVCSVAGMGKLLAISC